MKLVFLHVRTHLKWYLLLLLVTISVVLWFSVFREDRRGILTFAVLDVGQGDSLFIESPTGTQVLVDGGPNKTLLREIRKVLPWYDRHIDMLVVTNPDKDHYEGFIPLLDDYKVDVVLEAGTLSSTDAYKYLENKILQKKIPKVIAHRGQIIDLGGGAYLKILFPDRDVSGLSSNDGSIVMRLAYGDTSILLQGDSTSGIEHYLSRLEGKNLQSTILKAGHHGSRTSSSEEYVALVSPKWTVISSGEDNSYGHPHEETLETMEKFKISALDTCNAGRITFHSDGQVFILGNKNPPEAVMGCRK
jgi:competence protein ComEC